jgi:CDP-diacylglycerol---glycerol-3-phosphate 3-phosphatidyltransferase
MATIYDLKPAFQGLLRPCSNRLAAAGITANQVTVAAALLSLAAGAALALNPQSRAVFWLLPLVLFLRMALNAVDGMLAREHGQASKLGMYLNELADVVSDWALILPFAFVPPFPAWGVVGFALLAALCEFAGVLGIPANAGRVYAGPFGKSDRAAALGLVAAWLALGLPLPPSFAAWVFPFFALLSLLTVVNRVRTGLSRPGAALA